MNSQNPSPSPSPLVPQGSLLEQKNKGRSRVKLAFFFVVGVHVAALMVALLSQGCKREPVDDDRQHAANTVRHQPAARCRPDTNTAYVAPSNVPTPPVRAAASAGRAAGIRHPEGRYVIPPSRRNFTSPSKAIHDANPGVDPIKLQVGKKIVIPAPRRRRSSHRADRARCRQMQLAKQVYAVKSGDTSDQDCGTASARPSRRLRAANNLKTDKIKVGQKLKIPSRSPPPAPAKLCRRRAAPPAAPPAR